MSGLVDDTEAASANLLQLLKVVGIPRVLVDVIEHGVVTFADASPELRRVRLNRRFRCVKDGLATALGFLWVF